MKPVYIGSMFVETSSSIIEIGMVETDDGIIPGGVRDATTLRAPKVLPSILQVREAIILAKWCQEHECVFEGVVSRDPV